MCFLYMVVPQVHSHICTIINVTKEFLYRKWREDAWHVDDSLWYYSTCDQTDSLGPYMIIVSMKVKAKQLINMSDGL